MDQNGGEKLDASVAEGEPTMKLRAAPDCSAIADIAPACPPSAPITERPPLTPVTIVLPPIPSPPDRATLMVLGGARAGASYTLAGDETFIGRASEATHDVTIGLDDVSVSRRHARIHRDHDGAYWVEDLGSTNGTFVSGRRVKRARLSSGDRVQLGRESVFRFAIVDAAEEALQRRLYESTLVDTLTALANRRCLFERLGTEIWHARRERKRVALLVLDIDHFKTINDRFGHLAGDQVLRAIAQAGSMTLRGGDLFARYGGEELAVIARDAGMAEATVLAERLRSTIAAMHVEVGNGAVAVTVSIGVAELSECASSDDGRELFARADARLYAAKNAGRNRVCAASLPSSADVSPTLTSPGRPAHPEHPDAPDGDRAVDSPPPP